MIQEIARQLDRLYPSDVDAAPVAWGHGQEAGHIGHPAAEGHAPTIGWFCAGGNDGHPVCSIHPNDLPTLLARLTVLPDGALDGITIAEAAPFQGLRIEWYV